MSVRSLRSLLALAVVLVLAPAAWATHLPPQIMFDGTSVNSLGTLDTSGVPTWTLDSPETVDGVLIENWTVELDEDPFVTNNINVVNTTGSTQTFVATVVLPIPAFSYNAAIASSVGVTTTDSAGNGTLNFAQNGATPIFAGTVNGSTELPLNPPNLPLTTADCPVAFNGCTATSSTGVAFFALTPGVATTIGITLTFDLSPGASAGLTSRFEIVPEPGSLALAALGMAGVWFAGRRRRS